MKVLLEWYITLPTWKCVIGIVGLIVSYFLMKRIATTGVKNEKMSRLIFKILFFIRSASEVILTSIAIWASVINYQLTHILFSSLLIALLLPFLILLNHRVEDQIEFEKNNLYS